MAFARRRQLLLLTLLLTLTATALSVRVTNPKKVPKNAVLLSKVSALTVRAGKQTASRRVSPIPQLQCVGPSKVCKLYTVDTMRCTNEGADYDENSVQWSCKTSLPEEFKLGSTDVTCEGYESSDDPYVLKGSCGVEYRLLLTDKGEEKYGSSSPGWFDSGDSEGTGGASEKWAGYAFMAVFCMVLFVILRGIYNAWRREGPARRPRGGGGGGFGGGTGGDDNDPPPPYDPRPPRFGGSKKSTTASSPRTSTSSAGQQDGGWRPGVWTGAAAGGVAGYMAGRAARTQPPPPPAPARPFGGGWFGGGDAGGYDAPRRPSRPSTRTESASSSSYSSTRHESTGFGGTSRR